MRNARITIMTAATELFAKRGFAGSSIREICKSAGVTKPVLYYHFSSKEHLYQELMLDIFNQTRKDLIRLSNVHGSLRDRLILYMNSQFINCKKDPNSNRLLFRMMFSPEGEYPYFNFVKEFKRERKVVAGFIKEQFPEVKPSDPELISTAMMGMMLIAILEYLFTGRRTLTRKMAEKLVDLVLPRKSAGGLSLPVSKVKGVVL
jgi:TetR/AcrR family transcriptional regulator